MTHARGLLAPILGATLGILTALAPLAARASDDDYHCREVRPGHLECDDMVVQGRPQTPGGFYVLHRSALGWEATDLRRSFRREIVRSTGERPF
ncbi:MAG: hypothetical protein AB7S26_05730 [Sandaracinaceae bacterium]